MSAEALKDASAKRLDKEPPRHKRRGCPASERAALSGSKDEDAPASESVAQVSTSGEDASASESVAQVDASGEDAGASERGALACKADGKPLHIQDSSGNCLREKRAERAGTQK